MIKLFALLSRKSDMSIDEFIERYETRHVPLVYELVHHFDEYRRSFLRPAAVEPLREEEARTSPAFDVIVEQWYESQDQLDLVFRKMAETDAGTRIGEDETHQFDRTKMIIFAADERVSARFSSGWPTSTLPPLKLVRFMRARDGMPKEAIIEQNERTIVPLQEQLFVNRNLLAGYARSYPEVKQRGQMGHIEGDVPTMPYDMITEYWFDSGNDYHSFRDAWKDDAGAKLRAAEDQMFDVGATVTMLVEEHRKS